MYYAYIVYKDKETVRAYGITDNWKECQEITDKRPSKFKTFGRFEDATEFLKENLGEKYEK